jgi:hypothetical protein
MPTFLSDPPQVVFLVLVALTLLTGAIAFNTRHRASIIAFGVVLGVLLLLLILDFSFESPREESIRRVQAMVKAADAKNPAAFVEHLADTVEFHNSTGLPEHKKREALKASQFWEILKQYDVRVVAWDYSQLETTDPNKVEIGFMAKGESGGKPYPVYIRATFTRQPDGQMKLSGFRSLNPMNRTEPLPIPMLN